MNDENNDKLDKTTIDEDTVFKERVSYDKLTFYYLSLPIVLLGNILGALLLSALQFTVVDSYSIGIWLLLSVLVFLYQIYHYFTFKNEKEETKLQDADIWLDKYYTNILVNGIIWGSTAFLMFPESNILNQMIVMLFLFAIGFTSMGVLASKKDLLLTYVLVTYAPLILRLFFMEDTLYTKIAYVALSLMLIMVLVANYYGSIINQSLGNRQHFITIKDSHEKLKERFFSLFERAPVGIYYYNKDLELQDVNVHFMQMNKVDNKNMLINKSLHTLEKDERIIKAHQEVFDGVTGNYNGPFDVLDPNDNIYVKLSTVPMHNTEGEIAGGIAIVNDITNEVTAKQEMVRNAYYDMLTNIPNRTLLMDKLKSFIAQKDASKEYTALLFLDIDNFKKVNETYGHDVGDNLLKQVVNRVKNIIKSHEFFARISGNKFVILIPSLHQNIIESQKMTTQYIETLNQHFMQPLNVAGEEYHLSFSVGVMLFNTSKISAFDILKRSETAMYAAKKNARGTSEFYTDNMGLLSKEALVLENDIHKAINNNELSMHYQPQLDIQSGKIIGAEALVRWKHPTKGFISPATFIPIAEESGSIIKLEEWIFNKTIEDIKSLSLTKEGFPLRHIAINISTIHFLQPHFVEQLMLLVHKHKVEPQWIDLEITESGIMRNINDAIQKIKELKAFGFSFSIDDFGTGYSSLAYLKDLPIDIIKIDQSFVFTMHENKGNALIVESVITIGQKFNLKILAEGVENMGTLEQLSDIHCDYYQGNYAFKPLPFEEFKKILA